MSYQVLARRFRPQTFAKVIGQRHVTQALENAIKMGRIAHAFLFAGERGVGKTSVARILAKALNCQQSPTDQPCNKCAACREIIKGNAIDVHEIDGASNTSVDDIRTLRENVKYLPARDRHKIYIIDEVHMLSNSAFNALLKTLEEPPSHVIFIFATTEPQKIPSTIISRCLRFDFRRISTKEILEQLMMITQDEKVHISQRSLFLIAKASEGSVRDALSLLDRILSYCSDEVQDADVEQLLGRMDRSLLCRLTEAIFADNPEGCIDTLSTVYDVGTDLRQFYYAFLEHLRDLMIFKVSRTPATWLDLPGEDLKEIERLAAGVSPDELQRYFRLWFALEEEINRSALPKVALEMALLQMVQLKKSMPIDEILKKLDDLQKKLQAAGGTTIASRNAVGLSQAYNVREEPPNDFRVSAKVEDLSTNEKAEVLPADTEGNKDLETLLVFIRQKNLPLASMLDHGKLSFCPDSRLAIELPANSFFLENIKDSHTKKKLQDLCEEFFQKKIELRIVATKEEKQIACEDPKRQKSKKRQQEALRNPIIQKILEDFNGQIVEIKTDL